MRCQLVKHLSFQSGKTVALHVAWQLFAIIQVHLSLTKLYLVPWKICILTWQDRSMKCLRTLASSKHTVNKSSSVSSRRDNLQQWENEPHFMLSAVNFQVCFTHKGHLQEIFFNHGGILRYVHTYVSVVDSASAQCAPAGGSECDWVSLFYHSFMLLFTILHHGRGCGPGNVWSPI